MELIDKKKNVDFEGSHREIKDRFYYHSQVGFNSCGKSISGDVLISYYTVFICFG